MITASQLFKPKAYNYGEYKCYYCGLDCDNQFSTKEYVKKTFTNRDVVKFPGSNFVCGCCVASLITVTNTTLVDGEVKTGRGAAPRTYSWVLSTDGNTAFSKKHLDYARSILLNPPIPPFSIILSDSGKKQIIFRAPVNYNVSYYTVQFEESHIEIDVSKFSGYLIDATLASAAIGKKQLLTPNRFNNCRQCVELFGNGDVLEKWVSIHDEPMAKVAAWVCKGKKDARNENFVSSRISATLSRSERPAKSKRK